MRKFIKKAAYRLEDRLRALCGEITPGKKLAAILTVLLVCTAANIYIVFRAVYNLGRDSYTNIPGIGHITPPQLDKPGNRMAGDSIKGKGAGDESY
ncbi:DUF3989 domain-containing protein [Dysgonomonas sp. GY75]|uniref:TraL conjugative transposon family protein n=1 Tax=Dysgonomonas sp. GY75 TaxID=2780419 RepID=UPI0018833B37|nr:TraL conjugative transposon family protein [Dysgonomonas sp. GY75]MBF0647434.1 DUF3989 domain-containing protein [Dysgonomonas sp. GY75]